MREDYSWTSEAAQENARMTALCQELAKRFNAARRPRPGAVVKRISFADSHYMKLCGRRPFVDPPFEKVTGASDYWMGLEPYLEGKFIKWTNNDGFVRGETVSLECCH